MRNLKIINLFILMISIITLVSCTKDEELNSKELLGYIKSDDGGNNMVLNIVRTPMFTIGDSVARFAGYLTREAKVDVTLKVAVDTSLVTSYNKINKTSYQVLPTSNFKLISQNLNIQAGSMMSADSIKIQLLNPINLTNEKGYILPLSVNEVNTQDKGIVSSTNFKTIYLLINTIYTNIDPSNTPLVGTQMDRTGWTVTASGRYSNFVIENILDGKNATAWDASRPAWFILDMKSNRTVKGFSFVPNYQYRDENILGMDVFSSEDGTIWSEVGKYVGTVTSSSSSATNPDFKTVRFYTPVSTRYFRFVITNGSNGGYTGMNELFAIN